MSKLPAVGSRVRVTGILPDDPAPLEIGDEGEVTMVTERGQIVVAWDSGLGLMLLPGDPFEVVS